MAFGKFEKLADPGLTLVSGNPGQAFADDFMRRQGNDYNKALTDTNYNKLYDGGFGNSFTSLGQRSYKANPDSPELPQTLDNLFALKPANPEIIADQYNNIGTGAHQQFAKKHYSSYTQQNVRAAAALLANHDLVIVDVPAGQMHGKPSARIEANTVAITSGNLEITASDVLQTLQQPVDPTIKPQFKKPSGPGIDWKKVYPAGTRGLSFKAPST